MSVSQKGNESVRPLSRLFVGKIYCTSFVRVYQRSLTVVFLTVVRYNYGYLLNKEGGKERGGYFDIGD